MKTTGLLLLAMLGCGDDDPGGPTYSDRLEYVDPATGVSYGSTCELDDDCGPVPPAECCTGGKCGPDGWCSPTCDSDQDCPAGFYCIDHDGSRCFMGCDNQDNRECPLDFICEEKSGRFSCRYKD